MEAVLANRKPVFVFRLLFLCRVPERTFHGLSFHELPRKTRSRGAVPAAEDRPAQAPGMGVLGVRDPGADADADCFGIDAVAKLLHADL